MADDYPHAIVVRRRQGGFRIIPITPRVEAKPVISAETAEEMYTLLKDWWEYENELSTHNWTEIATRVQAIFDKVETQK